MMMMLMTTSIATRRVMTLMKPMKGPKTPITPAVILLSPPAIETIFATELKFKARKYKGMAKATLRALENLGRKSSRVSKKLTIATIKVTMIALEEQQGFLGRSTATSNIATY